jgi:hypothetical protein
MGAKTIFLAILAFAGASILTVHLIFRDAPPAAVAPTAPADLPAAPEAMVAAPHPPAAGLASSPDRARTPAASVEWERRLSGCVERILHSTGEDVVKPVLPGRWPAVKRAREKLRMRRLQLRAQCEQDPSLLPAP